LRLVKKALDDGKTGYCSAKGIPELRAAIANRVSEERGINYSPDEVVVQSGGKPIILKFLMTILEPGDEVLAPSPAYPIYESLTNFLGGVFKPYRFVEEDDRFELDLEYLKSLITPKTKLLFFNNYQNPTGWACSDYIMEQVAKLCIEHDIWVLSDEAYFDINYEPTSKSIVQLPGMKERTIILLTASKSFAMTGWRLGAAVGPLNVIEVFEKLTTNDEACTTNFYSVGWYCGLE